MEFFIERNEVIYYGMEVRHFVACCNCHIIWMIRDNSYNTCRSCGGHNISIYTFKNTIDKLEMIDGMYWDCEKDDYIYDNETNIC